MKRTVSSAVTPTTTVCISSAVDSGSAAATQSNVITFDPHALDRRQWDSRNISVIEFNAYPLLLLVFWPGTGRTCRPVLCRTFDHDGKQSREISPSDTRRSEDRRIALCRIVYLPCTCPAENNQKRKHIRRVNKQLLLYFIHFTGARLSRPQSTCC